MRVRPPCQPDPRIALVGIDKSDVDAYAKVRSDHCACALIPRSQVGAAVALLKAAKARTIALDIFFSQACPIGLGTPQAHDKPLTAALEKPGADMALITNTISTPDKIYFADPPPSLLGKSDPVLASPVLYNPRGVICGVSLVQLGTFPSDAEPQAPLIPVGMQYPALALATYAAATGRNHYVPEAIYNDSVCCAGRSIPVQSSDDVFLLEPVILGQQSPDVNDHMMMINWVGPTGTFPMYSLTELLRTDPAELRRRFANRIVIIGSVTDRKNTPFSRRAPVMAAPMVDQSREGAMSGIEIHANALDTLLRERYLRPVSRTIACAVVLLCSLLSALAFRRLKTWNAALVLLLQIGTLFAVAGYLINRDIWFYVVIPVSALLLSGVLTSLCCYAETRHRVDTLAHEAGARETATSTIIHDLKQPLAAISALTQVMRAQQQQGTTSPELLKLIQDEVDKALGDIDELLRTSVDKPIPLKLREFDIVALINALALTQGMKSSRHQVEVRAPEAGIQITGDPAYLGRAISNLIDNAIKYWPAGGTVIVEAAEQDDKLCIQVSDQGLGIDPHKQARIFDRYERAVPDGLDISGTGIGLYSVRRIVEAHSGSIAVESELGKGATFTISIPTKQPGSTDSEAGGTK